jgi:hypothetical protein
MTPLIDSREKLVRRPLTVRDPQRVKIDAELGLNVTIGIAAITRPDGHIVATTEGMISSNDYFQAVDGRTFKIKAFVDRWAMVFSGDANLFLPILEKSKDEHLQSLNYELDSVNHIQDIVSNVYREFFDKEFTATYLSRFGFKNIAEFRTNGLCQFGEKRFYEICNCIDEFDLKISLLCFGFSSDNIPHIFEVQNPGRVISHDFMQYGVIGSGFYMAMASLRRRHLTGNLEETIYRVLEAKFSAETASGVGKSTLLVTIDKDGNLGTVDRNEIEKIRKIWEKTLLEPAPRDAVEIISRTTAVTKLTGASVSKPEGALSVVLPRAEGGES